MTETRDAYATTNLWRELTATLPDVTRDEIASLLLAQLDNGWGVVEIVIRDHEVKAYRKSEDIRAKRPLVELT